MVLTRSQYENMSKEELIQELTDINSSFVNDINAKLTDLSEKFNEFTSKYDKVYSELQQCKSFNSHLLTRIIQLERNAVTNSQYSRRETTELNPVPAEIQDDVLEESVCKALSVTGVNVVPEDLINTENCLEIIRFMNFCHLVITKTRRQQHLLVAIRKVDCTIFTKNT